MGVAPVVGLLSSSGLVADFHVVSATAADDQAAEQRLARASCPLAAGEGAILADTLLLQQILLPGDVGGHAIGNQHADFLRRQEPFAAFGLTGNRILAARTVQSVGIGAGVDRVAQDRQDAIVRRATPLQLAAVGATQTA